MVKVDESYASVCCCPTMESVANASESRREGRPNINGRKQAPGWSDEKILIVSTI